MISQLLAHAENYLCMYVEKYYSEVPHWQMIEDAILTARFHMHDLASLHVLKENCFLVMSREKDPGNGRIHVM